MASTGQIKRDEYCQQFGFSDRTVQRWCQRLIDPAKFEAEKTKIANKCRELAELWQAANFSSNSVEWYTPKVYIDAAREVMGGIDLDPVSCA